MAWIATHLPCALPRKISCHRQLQARQLQCYQAHPPQEKLVCQHILHVVDGPPQLLHIVVKKDDFKITKYGQNGLKWTF